ncbi:MAG TPA: ABC transporter ATP-binding protein/permease, partial [Candidatus Acidoferrales bacterium]|nr:ABC transporter ATP-binding protein/permease [Candidatus Acidoferrales bacterium]
MIQVEGLEKSFEDVRAVDGVDLRVEQGQLLVLLGQNGAGKSTTLRCAGGILRPDAGRISMDGLQMPGDLDRIRARLGVVPDQARLYGRCTALEYLDHFGRLYGVAEPERGRRVHRLLERFELADRQDTVLWAFSRGMAQKVALIRATLHEPNWIFCDEPTAGLDPVAAADMRRYLAEQRERGAAMVVTTHVLGEAELIADRIAIMRRGRVVAEGTLDGLRRAAHPGRRFRAHLARAPEDGQALLAWLHANAQDPRLEGERLTYGLPWETPAAELAAFAGELQRRLLRLGTPYYELEEVEQSLEAVYLQAMETRPSEAVEPASAAKAPPAAGLRPSVMLRALLRQGPLLRTVLPFYVSSWWRRGDLSWVMYLNAFVLLLVAGTALFGALPGGLGQLASSLGGGRALQAGLLLPLFFMSFALLESIKSSIGVWWEKAQQSLEVLLYTPLDDPTLIWLEVLPGLVVSVVWVGFWMGAGLLLLWLFGRDAPWDLLPVFGLVAAITAYWAAMGRMLGFLLFPREGAAGGAWSFLLAPISAAVADLPLALFVFRSPLAPASLLIPLLACLALTLLCAASFDRERLLDAGLARARRRRRWLIPWPVLRRHAPALVVGLLLAAVPAGVGAGLSASAQVHSWPQARAALAGEHWSDPAPGPAPGSAASAARSGVTTAAAAMAGLVGTLGLMLFLVVVNFTAFFLLGVP